MPLLDVPVGFCKGEPATADEQDASLAIGRVEFAPCERPCPRILDLPALKRSELHSRTLRAVESANVAKLAALLDEAKSAHARYEEEHGSDPDWPRWYANYLLGRAT